MLSTKQFTLILALLVLVYPLKGSHSSIEQPAGQPLDRLEQLHELHAASLYSNPKESSRIANEGVELAKRLNNQRQLMTHYQNLAKSLLILNEPDSALHYNGFALSIALGEKDKRGVAVSTKIMGLANSQLSNYQTAIEYLNEALVLLKKLGISNEISDTYRALGDIYYDKGIPDKALEYYKEAVLIAEGSENPSEAADYYTLIGAIYHERGDVEKALSHFIRALELHEKVGNKASMASNLNRIGGIHFSLQNHSKALDYIRQSLAIETEIGNKSGISLNYYALGWVYNRIQQYDSALYYTDKSITINKEIDNTNGLARSYETKGKILKSQQKYSESIGFFIKANEINRSLGNRYNTATTLFEIGILYYNLSQIGKALPYITESMGLAKQNMYMLLLQDIYPTLADIYRDLGKPNLESQYLREYLTVMDSLNTMERQRLTADVLEKYETEKKEQEILILNQQNELQRAELKRSRILLLFSITGLLLLGALAGFASLLYRNKSISNKLLTEKNAEIVVQKEEIQSQKEQLERQTSLLKELDEAKSVFFSNISHEFRTPLTLILGPLEGLIKETKGSKQEQQLEMIRRHAGKLLKLINQLLALSRIEKNGLELSTSVFDLNGILRRTFFSFSSQAESKGVKFNYSSTEQSIPIEADREKLETIATNLIANAVKYTNSGGTVTINVSTSQGKVAIAVCDTGRGIAEEDQGLIFNRFHRSKNAEYTEGTGIGLALAKELTDLHNGQLTVESKLGEGSTFTLFLPFESTLQIPNDNQGEDIVATPSQHEISSLPKTNASESDGELARILIVEDNLDMQEYLLQNLKEHYQVRIASNGEEALEALNEYEPNLIVSDVMMPRMDGFELTQRVKSDGILSHIPIVLLTAKSEHSDKLHGLGIRADDYITKPFSMDELTLRIGNLIEARETMRRRFEKQIIISPSDITTTSLDEQLISKAIATVEENMDNSEFSVEEFCSRLGMSRTNLHRKLKALTNHSTSEFIREIRLKRAAQLVSSNSHSISEVSYMVGFNDLSYFTKCFKRSFGKLPSEFGREG